MPDEFYVSLGLLSERITLAKELIQEFDKFSFLKKEYRISEDLLLSHNTIRIINNLKFYISNFNDGSFSDFSPTDEDVANRVKLNSSISEAKLWLLALLYSAKEKEKN